MKKKLSLLGLIVTSTSAFAVSLLPFQGHLTNTDGQSISDGSRVIQFKIYDAPVSGSTVWAGEVHKLTVNSGLVSTILGTKTTLEGIDFSETLYVEITIDANGDNHITASDPPLLPRQALQPTLFAVEAANARQVEGVDLIDETTGTLRPSILRENSIPAQSITANDAITANQLAVNSVSTAEIAPAAVRSNEIANGTISLEDLSPELLRFLNPPGTVQAYAGEVAPSGWLLCHGQSLNRAGHQELFAAIGRAHGTASETTFNLPDYRGRFLRGVDGADGGDSDRDPDSSTRAAMFPGGNAAGVGSVQSDAFQGHYHLNRYSDRFTGYGSAGNGWQSNFTSNFKESTSSEAFVIDPVDDGVNGVPRVAKETRVKNAYINFIIKL